MGYDPSLATWMALFFFSAGASRFYFARAKQLYINEPSPQIHGQFADKELNYFYVSNTALSGSAWFGLIFTQCCRLALCLVISNYSTVTAGFVITMIFVAIVFLMTPALSLGPKCFPPRTLRHSFTVKLFVVLCSVIMAGSLISSTELAGNKLGPKNIQQMQIAGVSQLLYAVVLMAGPKLLPLHICEALGLMLQLGLWQPVSVVMGNTPGTQF
jgi:hypothetical protein